MPNNSKNRQVFPDCPIGTWSDEKGLSTSCTQCGTCESGLARYRCSGTFEGVCTPCVPGHFVNLSAQSCSPCPVMHYSGISNAASCTACEAGKYQAEQGKTFCNAKAQCIPGEYVAQPLKLDASRCAKCPVMHYSNATNAAACQACPAGKNASQLGATSCTACIPGYYSSSSRQTSCTACDPGTFSTSSDSIACRACPAGKASSQSGASSCTACTPVRYSSSSGYTSCTPCDEGTFSATSDAASRAATPPAAPQRVLG